MNEEERDQLRQRMWRRRELLLDHDHRDGPEDGCFCADIYKEIREIWHKLNDGKPQFNPRAGPRPPSGDPDRPSVELENWQFLKDREHDYDE